MELDWTTFGLEVINFLILVWLLKRFLYQPVLNVIETRRQKISAELLQSAEAQEQAQALKSQYEARLVDWKQEKRAALDTLDHELARERDKKLQKLDAELEQQRLKHQARDQQQQAQWRTQAEAEALQLGSAFATRLLQELAGPELDQRLQQFFIDRLGALPENELSELRREGQGDTVSIEVLSATVLDAGREQAIREALERRLGPFDARWQFSQDESLIAGLRVSIGDRVLHANLRDELRFFSEAAHGW